MEGRVIPLTNYTWITPQDTAQQFTVFKAINAAGKLVARAHLADLACQRCGRVDETKALCRPIKLDVRIRAKRDLLGSFDLQDLVSDRLMTFLDELAPGEHKFFPIVDNPEYLAIEPTTILAPSKVDPAFHYTDQCGRCHRFRDITCKGKPMIIPDLTLAAFQLENRIGRNLAWFASDTLVAQLKKAMPKLKGVNLSPM